MSLTEKYMYRVNKSGCMSGWFTIIIEKEIKSAVSGHFLAKV